MSARRARGHKKSQRAIVKTCGDRGAEEGDTRDSHTHTNTDGQGGSTTAAGAVNAPSIRPGKPQPIPHSTSIPAVDASTISTTATGLISSHIHRTEQHATTSAKAFGPEQAATRDAIRSSHEDAASSPGEHRRVTCRVREASRAVAPRSLGAAQGQ